MLVGCSASNAAEPTLQASLPTPTTLAVTQLLRTTPGPIVTATRVGVVVVGVVTATPLTGIATLEPATAACLIQTEAAPHDYELSATIDRKTNQVSVQMAATFRNDGDQALNQLVMHIDPNRVPGVFTLTSLQGTDSAPVVSYALTGPRLDIVLAKPIQPRCNGVIKLDYTLQVLPVEQARLPYLAYTPRQFNLGHWLPQFPPRQNDDWIIPRAWTIGEYFVGSRGDYRVRATVVNAESEAVSVIGPGNVERLNPTTWQFTLYDARSFTLLVSAAMSFLNTTTVDGLQIDLYSFAAGQPEKSPDGAPINGPQFALNTTKAAAEQLTALFGKLPNKRLVIVEGDFRDGMEFSGIVYVGHKWFADYEGKPDSWLTLITAHEVSHQWWYSLVANDQGDAPFLDEGLAIYSEVLFLEAHYPQLVPWWWTFRVKIQQPQGFVDAKANEFSSGRLYINAVYLRGASMLQELRDVMGDRAFIAWLQTYTRENRDRIATWRDLWRAMSPADYARTEPIRWKYLRTADPLGVLVTPLPTATVTP